jgi:hypothetical protein
MQRPPARLVPLAFGLVVVLLVSSAGARADDATGLIAVHDGVQIALTDVVRYHCHDGSHPVIRCFDTWRTSRRLAGIQGSPYFRRIAS